MADKAKEPGVTIAGKKIPYKVIALGGAGALALFILTRGKGGGGTTGVPVFGSGTGQSITTEVPVAPDLTSINDQLAALLKDYQDLLSGQNAVDHSQPKLYQVQQGDTLASIAQRFNISARDIIHFNEWLVGNRGKFDAGGFVNRYIYIPEPAAAS